MKRKHALIRQLSTSGVDLMAQMPLMSEALKRLVPSFSLSMIRVDEHCAPIEHYSEYFDDFSHELFETAGHQFSADTTDPAAFGNLLRHPRPFGTLIDTPPSYLAGATYEHLSSATAFITASTWRFVTRTPLGILGIFREEGAAIYQERSGPSPSSILLVHAFAAPPLPAS